MKTCSHCHERFQERFNYSTFNLFGGLFYVCPQCWATAVQELIGKDVAAWLASEKYQRFHKCVIGATT